MNTRTKWFTAAVALLVAIVAAYFTVQANNSEQAHASASADYFQKWDEYSELPGFVIPLPVVTSCEKLEVDCSDLDAAIKDLDQFPDIGRKDIGALSAREVRAETKKLTEAIAVHEKLTEQLKAAKEEALEVFSEVEADWRAEVFQPALDRARVVLQAAPVSVRTEALAEVVDEAEAIQATASPLRHHDLVERLDGEREAVEEALTDRRAEDPQTTPLPQSPAARPAPQQPAPQPAPGPQPDPAPPPTPDPAPESPTPQPSPQPPVPEPTAPVEPEPPVQEPDPPPADPPPADPEGD